MRDGSGIAVALLIAAVWVAGCSSHPRVPEEAETQVVVVPDPDHPHVQDHELHPERDHDREHAVEAATSRDEVPAHMRVPGDDAFSDRLPWYDRERDVETDTAALAEDPFTNRPSTPDPNVVAESIADSLVPMLGRPVLEPSRFFTPTDVLERLGDRDFVLVDVRPRESYDAAHLPSAIHLDAARFVEAHAEGMPQTFLRDEFGAFDVERYEAILGDAGLAPHHDICVYGNLHAGSEHPSAAIPAAVLDLLGHESVSLLTGSVLDYWTAEGYTTSDVPHELPRSVYAAQPRPNGVWDLEQVFEGLGGSNALFLDVRSFARYDGENHGEHRFGGHVPGAVNFAAHELFEPQAPARVCSRDEIAVKLATKSIVGDKHRVLYGTDPGWASFVYFALRDLGHEDVAIYDAGWSEYGNREDTPIDERTLPPLRN